MSVDLKILENAIRYQAFNDQTWTNLFGTNQANSPGKFVHPVQNNEWLDILWFCLLRLKNVLLS